MPHQANLRILSQVSQRLDVPLDRFVLNIERYGNTSSASIPIALDEARPRRSHPARGDTVLMCALGAGISWASSWSESERPVSVKIAWLFPGQHGDLGQESFARSKLGLPGCWRTW